MDDCDRISHKKSVTFRFLENGILTYRRMVKKKDIVKVFVIYLSLCHVSPAHPCGENPLRTLISISFKTGHPLRSVLLALREMDGSIYKQLQVDFQRYAGCIGIVDTGYFKRSSASDMKSKRTFQSEHGYDGDLQLFKPLTSNRNKTAERLLLLEKTKQLLDSELFPFSRQLKRVLR
uniref:Uncharacterized protein LOC111138324 isoform X1 n=2 Tax=Crassostrea virginica TaxID=6565 RepID=A0A8B8F106_CRAVI|nr:uncharacterized protein LOC111138324 isoform X1 [Crassostrea virginica]